MSDKQTSFLNQLKKGDVIRAYRKGVHVVVRVEDRHVNKETLKYHPSMHLGDRYNSLIHYKQITREDGSAVKGKTVYTCDESWCSIITEKDFQAQIDRLQEKQQAILELKEQIMGDAKKAVQS
jgi:hypothetical protein